MQERCNRAFVFLVPVIEGGQNYIQPRNAFFQRVTLHVVPLPSFVAPSSWSKQRSRRFYQTSFPPISIVRLVSNETSNKKLDKRFLNGQKWTFSLSLYIFYFIFLFSFFFFTFHVSRSISSQRQQRSARTYFTRDLYQQSISESNIRRISFIAGLIKLVYRHAHPLPCCLLPSRLRPGGGPRFVPVATSSEYCPTRMIINIYQQRVV